MFLFLPSWNSSLMAEIEASLEARGRSQVLRQPKQERRNPDLTALPSDQPGTAHVYVRQKHTAIFLELRYFGVSGSHCKTEP